MRVCPRCKLRYGDGDERCFVDGTPLEQVQDPNIGKVLGGRYRIESEIGEGGMATVYRARHTLVDSPVAVKIMAAHLARDPSLLERFRREAKNASSLAHPNIVEIHDSGVSEDGAAYIVMELLDGQPLSKLIDAGPIEPSLVAAIGLQVAQGLARAHDFEVIHRDLKPDNVFVCLGEDGRTVVKLLDFGVARSLHDPRLTSAGQVFGTPEYLAPERVTSIDAGASADLYSLGVILFEMVTGRTPFVADNLPALLMAHLMDEPPRPSELAPRCPRRLEELVLRLLAKEPTERPVDAHQVVKELAALTPDEGRGSVPPAPPSGISTLPPRPAAPTLPPTSLDRWLRRADIFADMLRRAYPSGGHPRELGEALAAIRAALASSGDLRTDSLAAQRKLERLETAVRDGRERLGHAVEALGEDLSRAREAARSAATDAEPYFAAERAAEAAYRKAHGALVAAGGYRELDAPRPDLVGPLRDVAESLDRWVLARGAADKARRWTDAKASEVTDLEFQVKELRGNLDRLEASYGGERETTEESLRKNGAALERLEGELIRLGTQFCEPLRGRPELRAVFAQLEAEARSGR